MDSEIELSPLGRIVLDCWQQLATRFTNIELLEHVVMPNHFHGVIWIKPPGAQSVSSETDAPFVALSRLVHSLKAGVTRLARVAIGVDKVWQDDYYDHVVRGEEDLYRIRQYIRDNPRQWHLDRENEQRTGLNPFYAYLESFGDIPKESSGRHS
ncbi:transposase [bacterium]|nr:transposase [bacterium]